MLAARSAPVWVGLTQQLSTKNTRLPCSSLAPGWGWGEGLVSVCVCVCVSQHLADRTPAALPKDKDSLCTHSSHAAGKLTIWRASSSQAVRRLSPHHHPWRLLLRPLHPTLQEEGGRWLK